MPQNDGTKVGMAPLYFVAGFAGTAVLLLLASNPVRCVLEDQSIDLTVALVVALLSGMGAALVALLPDRTRRLVVSLYSGIVMALVGFIVLVWFSPSPPAERCSVPGSSAAVAGPTTMDTPIPRPTATDAPTLAATPLTFHSVIPVPGKPSVTGPQPASCPSPPAWWVRYTVRADDTLYRLAVGTGTSVRELMYYNCLADSILFVGFMLWLPRSPLPPTPAPPSIVSPSSSTNMPPRTMLSPLPTITPRPTRTPSG